MIDDVEAVERVEAELDAFILKRSRSQEAANREEEAWKASTKLVNEKARRRRKAEWISYYGHMNRVHLSLAAGTPGKRGARSLAPVFGLDRRDIARHERMCLVGERRERGEADLERLGEGRKP